MWRKQSLALLTTFALMALPACGGEAGETEFAGGDTAAAAAETTPGTTTPGTATPGTTTPGTTTPAGGDHGGDVAVGQQVFTSKGNCFTCHGQAGEGSQLGPNLTDNQWLNITGQTGQPTTEQIVNVIRTGVPQPKQFPSGMPPMGGAQLSDDEIRNVAAYVHSLSSGH